MKLVIAFIKPERLGAVKQALYEAEIYSLSVTNVVGSGRQKGFAETYRGVQREVNLLHKVRIEIGVNDDLVERTCQAIVKGARTGTIGDGVIFVVPVDHALRIRTGEEDSAAVA